MKKTLKILLLAVFFSRLLFLNMAFAQQESLSLAPLIQDLEKEIKKQDDLCDYLTRKYENILKEKNILQKEIKAVELKKKRRIRTPGTKAGCRPRKIPGNSREERGKKEAAAQKKQLELEMLGNRLEIKRLQAEEKEKRLSVERQQEIDLSLEAERFYRYDRYIASLKALLDRQDNLLKESINLEQKIQQEEQDLLIQQENRQILLRKLLEETPEAANL